MRVTRARTEEGRGCVLHHRSQFQGGWCWFPIPRTVQINSLGSLIHRAHTLGRSTDRRVFVARLGVVIARVNAAKGELQSRPK